MHRDKEKANIENFKNSREIKFYLLAARRAEGLPGGSIASFGAA